MRTLHFYSTLEEAQEAFRVFPFNSKQEKNWQQLRITGDDDEHLFRSGSSVDDAYRLQGISFTHLEIDKRVPTALKERLLYLRRWPLEKPTL